MKTTQPLKLLALLTYLALADAQSQTHTDSVPSTNSVPNPKGLMELMPQFGLIMGASFSLTKNN